MMNEIIQIIFIIIIIATDKHDLNMSSYAKQLITLQYKDKKQNN